MSRRSASTRKPVPSLSTVDVLPPSPASTMRASVDSHASSDVSTKGPYADELWEAIQIPFTPPRVHRADSTPPRTTTETGKLTLKVDTAVSPKTRIIKLSDPEKRRDQVSVQVVGLGSPPPYHRLDGMPQSHRKPKLEKLIIKPTVTELSKPRATVAQELPKPKITVTRDSPKPETPVREEKPTFHPTALPDGQALDRAMSCLLVDENGMQTTFGDVIDRHHRTAVLFIRHFWCGFCQTYVEHLASSVKEEGVQQRVAAAKVKVVIIGHGHPSVLAKYKALLKSPFPIYTDPSQRNDLFTALGMTRRTTDPGPSSEKGDYLAGVSMADAIIKGTVNGVKMPLFVSPGDMKLLGGEFVFEPLRPHSIRRKPPSLNVHRTLNRPLPVPPKSPRRAARVTSSYPLLAVAGVRPSEKDGAKVDATKKDDKPVHRASTSLPVVPKVPVFVGPKRRYSSAPAGLNRLASLSRRQSRSREGSLSSLSEGEVEATSQAVVKKSSLGTVQIRCRYAHRMSTTRDHASISEIFAAAGVLLKPAGLTPYAKVAAASRGSRKSK